ncbi:MAG: lipoxygenase family protein [Pirellulales bacterium]
MSKPQFQTRPSQYQLPQHVSADRRRARTLTIAMNRERYPLAFDPGLPDAPESHLPPSTAPWPGMSRLRRLLIRLKSMLPPKDLFISELPPESQFTWPKFFRHGAHAGSMKIRQIFSLLTNLDFNPMSEEAYGRLLNTIPAPRVKNSWQQDEEFARQRLAGVNPMAIRRCAALPHELLASAAHRFLSDKHGASLNSAFDSGRLYTTEYPLLWERPVQEKVRAGATLAAPTCLFYVDDRDVLMPIAIQLKPADAKRGNPVFTPASGVWDWRMARAHAQASDSHYHEAIYHLLETHLVCEVFALSTHRNLHPDHPLLQLLMPHFEHTLAINEQARKNLLGNHGEIARCMAAQHTGNINLLRMIWPSWDIRDHQLTSDLRHRDVNDLPGYLYRDDALEVHRAIEEYARGILTIWYADDEDVRNDHELQAWAREIADPQLGQVRGFPAELSTRDQLIDIAANVIFRASAQHAAVNNGQFGAYGWVPNAPVAVYRELPGEAPADGSGLFSERDYYAALPDRARTFGQTGMVWLLSEPTHRSLFQSGEIPAFSQENCFEAFRVVARFRHRLRAISDAIDLRNGQIGYQYNFLKPQNIDQSVSI